MIQMHLHLPCKQTDQIFPQVVCHWKSESWRTTSNHFICIHWKLYNFYLPGSLRLPWIVSTSVHICRCQIWV